MRSRSASIAIHTLATQNGAPGSVDATAVPMAPAMNHTVRNAVTPIHASVPTTDIHDNNSA